MSHTSIYKLSRLERGRPYIDCCQEPPEEDEAIGYIVKGMEAGCPMSYALLADLHRAGICRPSSDERAVGLYLEAIDRGVEPNSGVLEYIYHNLAEYGVVPTDLMVKYLMQYVKYEPYSACVMWPYEDVDIRTTEEFIDLAARNGFYKGYAILADMYSSGDGCPASPGKALEYYLAVHTKYEGHGHDLLKI